MTSLVRTVGGVVAGLAVAVPLLASAQSMPYTQVVVTTQTASGFTLPAGMLPSVTVTGTGPSFSIVPNTTSPTLSYTSSFVNDTRTITMVPGSYTVAATGGNYYYSYSQDCSGFTTTGVTRTCVITVSATAPATNYPCSNAYNNYYGNSYGCVVPIVPYTGPTEQAPLTCSPAYQTVPAGKAVVVSATGGVANSNTTYNWTTTDRTYLGMGPVLSTMLQTTGVQTIIVTSGTQSASCTVNVVAGAGPIVYSGTTPSVTAAYVPATLPNTGFEPTDGFALALALVFVFAAGIVVLPYVKRTALAITR